MGTSEGKLFGIGLRKTGTRSIAAATRALGLRTLHKGGRGTSNLVEQAEAEGVPLLTHLGEGYDAYFDVKAIETRYAELDRQYPGSRFILSLRDEEAWLDSYEKHVLGNQARAKRGEYDGVLLIVDREAWRAERAAHHEAVRAYFADRPGDLLEFDIGVGDGWEKLAPFLGKPIPTEPFPWENRDGEGTYRAAKGGVARKAAGLASRVKARLNR
jgi:hypothetical protein